MVDMPRDCEQCRLRLLINYNRFLAWGKVIGLTDAPNERIMVSQLGENAIELCAIITKIKWLLEEFSKLNARWKDELNPYRQYERGYPEPMDLDIVQGASSLEVAYEKAQKDYKDLRWTQHIASWMSKKIDHAKELASHPYRVRWAMVDRQAFEALLKDLHILTERLHQLVGDQRQARIDDITAQTYRELVLARNDVHELKDMLGAVTASITCAKGLVLRACAADPPHWSEETFRDLLHLKKVNRTADAILDKIESNDDCSVDSLEELINVDMYDGSAVEHFNDADTGRVSILTQLRRARGCLVQNGQNVEAWVEWRYSGAKPESSTSDKAARVRVMTLAQMLSISKPMGLYAPKCIGFIDDAEFNGRYGWLFALPEGSGHETRLKSLYSILGQNQHKPTLNQRVTLAWKLASSVMCLHTADWLHKGIHGDNVLFCFEGDQYDAEKPMLSGFDYARSQSSKTTSRSLEPKWDIYRWPGIQNEPPYKANSRKTYDIYSLGLILLEIAHWKPLNQIMGLKRWPEPSRQDARIRDWLLGGDYPPVEPNPLLELRSIAGDRYWKAVRRCIHAHGEEGLCIGEAASQAWCTDVGTKLHAAFDELVLRELKEVARGLA